LLSLASPTNDQICDFFTVLYFLNQIRHPSGFFDGVKVLETVIVEFNKRFGDGINVTEFREGPGRQPQGYTKVSSILV